MEKAHVTGTLVRLTRNRWSEHQSWTDDFIADETVTNPEEALRNAVADFVKTDEGRESVIASSFDFNWGDAIQDMPDEYWTRRGMHYLYDSMTYTVTGSPVDIAVSQDELLFNDSDFEEGE